jgi:hypothetical protein
MAIYYPAAKVILTVRWEDYLRDGSPEVQGSDARLHRRLQRLQNNESSFVLDPLRFVVEQNGIRTADRVMKLELDGRDFPFDPRLARSVEIAVFVGQRERATSEYVFKRPEVIPPDDETSPAGDEQDRIFAGFADDFRRSHDERGHVVTLEGRDYTSLFLDAPYPVANIATKGSIEETLRDWVHGAEPTKGFGLPAAQIIRVVVDDSCSEVTTNSLVVSGKAKETKPAGHGKAKAGGRTVIGQTASKALAAKGKAVGAQHSYWDVIQDLCDQLGLVAFIRGTDLIVTAPRNLTTLQTLTAPYLVWGRNIERLEVKKKLGRLRAPNIEIVSHARGKAKRHSAVYPHRPGDIHRPGLSYATVVDNEGKETKQYRVDRYYVGGLSSDAACMAVAQRVFEDIASNEIEVLVETREMLAFDEDELPNEHSLTRVRDGTPIGIRVEGDLQSLLQNKSVPERTQLLEAHGYLPAVALAFAEHWDSMRAFSSVFRTRAARHDWDVQTGYKLTIEAVNYLNASGLPDGIG